MFVSRKGCFGMNYLDGMSNSDRKINCCRKGYFGKDVFFDNILSSSGGGTVSVGENYPAEYHSESIKAAARLNEK
jgi:hypothetical protein